MSELSQIAKILIVEDDPSIRFGLGEVFSAEGFAIATCDRGDRVGQAIGEAKPDLIILDVMLPGRSGYEICSALRKEGCRVPVLMLTAKGQEMDKVVGFDSGADDYVTKPFGVRELVARVRALLRRSGHGSETPQNVSASTGFLIGPVRISERTYEVLQPDGTSERLTPKEMDLLKYLHAHRGEVKSRDAILDAVWGVRYFGTTRTLDQCVAQLRKKLGDSGQASGLLRTVHGVGYVLEL
ncbi:MAG TPA: response regulator transcription factor [Verrucomicrobiales bacterium]|nr:response regulator transcription factor [Akkermansiaceae bacterium]HRX53990.1 response regulator transcription factor [Verrucomicrobiales bacterium]